MTNLSEAARSALLAAPSSRVGTPVPRVAVPVAVLAELKDAKLISVYFNLTRKGSIERERIFTAELDKAFG